MDRKLTVKKGRPPKMDDKMDVSLTIKLPTQLRDAANEKSRNTGVPISFVVRKALESWIAEG